MPNVSTIWTKIFIAVTTRSQYDEFLHKIQQPKMKELWDNKEDVALEYPI